MCGVECMVERGRAGDGRVRYGRCWAAQGRAGKGGVDVGYGCYKWSGTEQGRRRMGGLG